MNLLGGNNISQRVGVPLVLCGVLSFFAYAQDDQAPFVVNDAMLQAVKKQYGKRAMWRVEEWGELLEKSRKKTQWSDAKRLGVANDFFNRIKWVSDQEHWGLEDYWATPIETLATNAGDCEDFSIGKYFTLREGRIDTDKLRITYVKALDYNQAHMVLAYYKTPSAEPLILDNINQRILPASKRKDLVPVYSFNGESLWLARSRDQKMNVNSQTSLPQWANVNQRMLKELGLKSN